jgi:hypothetical protein
LINEALNHCVPSHDSREGVCAFRHLVAIPLDRNFRRHCFLAPPFRIRYTPACDPGRSMSAIAVRTNPQARLDDGAVVRIAASVLCRPALVPALPVLLNHGTTLGHETGFPKKHAKRKSSCYQRVAQSSRATERNRRSRVIRAQDLSRGRPPVQDSPHDRFADRFSGACQSLKSGHRLSVLFREDSAILAFPATTPPASCPQSYAYALVTFWSSFRLNADRTSLARPSQNDIPIPARWRSRVGWN